MSDPKLLASKHSMEIVRMNMEVVLDHAKAMGVVVTVEQRPLLPLAMGHYETVFMVRSEVERPWKGSGDSSEQEQA